jgi:MFS family permease
MSALDKTLGTVMPSATNHDTASATRAGWFMVIVLMSSYLIGAIDRGVLSMVVEPVRATLQLSDIQISVLLGMANMLMLAILTLPVGYLVDRVNRRNMVIGTMGICATMEIACAFARSFLTLFLPRVGIGTNDAALPPAAYSMIRDTFPEQKRGLAYAVFHMAPIAGTGLAMIVTSWVLDAAAAGRFAGIPVLSALAPWQAAFVVPGVIGGALALLLFFVREPARVSASHDDDLVSLPDAVRHLARDFGLYGPLWAAITLFLIAANGFGMWLPQGAASAWSVPITKLGPIIGLIVMVSAPLGLMVMGALMDRLTRIGIHDAPILVAIAGLAVATLGTAAMVLVLDHPSRLAALLLAIQILFLGACPCAGGAAMAMITPGRLMGKLTAVFFLIQSLLGVGLGPTVAAVVSRWFFTGPQSIAQGMIATFVACGVLAILFLALLSFQLRRRHQTALGGKRA